jgi:hypothetical protein
MTPDRDRGTIPDQPELVDQTNNMAMANEIGSMNSGYVKDRFSESAPADSFYSVSRAALLDVGSDNPNGEGAVMSSPRSDAHPR